MNKQHRFYVGSVVKKIFTFHVFASLAVINMIKDKIASGERSCLIDCSFKIVPWQFSPLVSHRRKGVLESCLVRIKLSSIDRNAIGERIHATGFSLEFFSHKITVRFVPNYSPEKTTWPSISNKPTAICGTVKNMWKDLSAQYVKNCTLKRKMSKNTRKHIPLVWMQNLKKY